MFICLSLHSRSLIASCKIQACKDAVAWKNGYTAIILADDIAEKEYLTVLAAVKANGGVVAIEAERVFLGWIPRPVGAKIRSLSGVQEVVYAPVPHPADLVRRPDPLSALEFFNRVLTGAYEDSLEAGLAISGEPLTGDAILLTASPAPQSLSLNTTAQSHTDGDTNRNQPTDARQSITTPPNAVGRGKPSWFFPTPYQNPDMRGRVTVQLFRPDSDGTVDPNLYSWTDSDWNLALDQVYGSFTFWVSQAAARSITLSFGVRRMDLFSRFCRCWVPVPTKYEPITHRSTDDYLWVNDALAPFGYGASPVTLDNVYAKNVAFNNYKKTDEYGGFDRSFSVYIIYNPGSAPSTFANGTRAYTIFDGPFVMMMWNSAGFGPNNIGRVLTHETGHIFWACDEYYDSASHTGCFNCDPCFYNVGPRNQVATPWITNGNCDYPSSSPTCDIPRVDCIMRTNGYAICPHTPGQIGW
jgi:hypothetical protein